MKLAVIGAGLLGIKIAIEAARFGHKVKLYDCDAKKLDTVYLRVEADVKQLVEVGIMPTPHLVGQITMSSSLEDALKDVAMVIECVIEDLNVKQSLFEQISQLCPKDCILTSNSMGFNVAQIFEKVSDRSRTLGLRFLYPVFCIPEVELTPGSETSPETLSRVRTFVCGLGKTLFFRGPEGPLVLNDEQRAARLEASVSGKSMTVFLANRIQPSNASDPIASTLAFTDLGDQRTSECVICFDNPRQELFDPCHHLAVCSVCARELIKKREPCPVCRSPIIDTIHVYHS